MQAKHAPMFVKGFDAFKTGEPISNAPWGAPRESADWRMGWLSARAGNSRPDHNPKADGEQA